jgi:hypothetical protein
VAHRCFALAALGCVMAFGWMVTGGGWRLAYPDAFGDFYDHQAASLLKGRLDVPKDAIGWEAFVVDGKYYGYFGPTPAVLRIPFVALGLGFGRLTRPFLIAFYVVALLAAYATLRHATRLATAKRPAPWSVVALTLNAGLGSTLFFLAGRAFTYHESILCGAAFATAAGYCSVRALEPGHRSWWGVGLASGLLAVQARPTSGLVAFGMLGCSALAVLLEEWRSSGHRVTVRSWRVPLSVAALSVLGVLSYGAVNYIKFGTFVDGAPMQYHVQATPELLAAIGGTKFRVANVRYTFDTYVRRCVVDLRPTFPYVYMSRPSPDEYPEARMWYPERTLAIPYAMPGLTALAVAGCLYGFRRCPPLRSPILVLAGGTVPLVIAMGTATAVTHRYTADFCPPLILGAALGSAALAARPRVPIAVRATVVALTALAVLVTFAITLQYQGEGIWGTPDDVKARFQHMRERVDGAFR